MVHKNNCVVSIIMGSDSDWKILEKAADALGMFDIGYEVEVVSAHRTPHKLVDFSTHAHERGIKVIIAGAGGAAHLPGMVASLTTLPVIAVPVALKNLMGIDSLLSIVQMPAGVPVGTMSIDGAFNAGLYAVRILALNDSQLQQEVEKYHLSLKEIVEEKNASLHQQHAQRDA